MISLDVANRSLMIHLSDEELASRKLKGQNTEAKVARGYVGLYIRHVQQAHLGADLDILNGGSDGEVTRDLH